MEYYPNQGDRQLPPYYQSGEVPPEAIPPQYKPLSPWAYLGYQILFSIPVVGLIALIIFALNNDNVNRRNFARSYFCVLVIAIVLFVIILMFAPAFTSGGRA